MIPEHLAVSPSKKDYGMSVPRLYEKALKAAKARGLTGGNIIYHQERYTPERGWYFSPHFHFLSYIDGGYKCRECKKSAWASESTCGDCDGFEARTRREYKKDGFIVEVAKDREGKKAVRKSIFHTMYYQLDHASYQISAKRRNIVRWFGTHSYRRMKVKVVKKYVGCPICSSRLKHMDYTGDDPKILGLMRRRMRSEDRDAIVDAFENGVSHWEDVAEEVPAYMFKYIGRESERFVYGHLD
jgi:hypothetical protein